MRRVVVGTAGHIDHGKTRLVAALTGIDCDRLAEEKSRGITIDLGFAHLTQDDLQLGFVDVPGHERFIHNALAGLGGIRLMILVVAADEGVKPQTREHLAICTLLRIPAGVAVLTKADLVPEDLLDLARMELEELLQESPFAQAPILAVSSLTGEGIPELKESLFQLAAEVEAKSSRKSPFAAPGPATETDAEPVRLPVDRAFHLRGLGAIVTGTLVSGRVRSGDTLSLLPALPSADEMKVRVRSVEVHGHKREEAGAGERTSLQLSGISLDALQRGVELTTPGAYGAGSVLCAHFTLLPEAPKPVKGFAPIRFHLYAAEAVGKIRALDPPEIPPGGEGVVEIRLNQPVVAARGDRFIVRRPSPQTTLGGGEILDPEWRRRRGKASVQAAGAVVGETEKALLYWVESAGEGGTAAHDLARRLAVATEEVEEALSHLASEQRLLEVPVGGGQPKRWLAPAAYQRVVGRAQRVLKEYFRRERLARGMSKAEAVRRILPGRAGSLTDVYLSWLQAQKVLVLEEDLVNLPGRGSQLTEEESDLAKAIVEGFERQGLTPASPAELQRSMAAKPQIFDGVLRYLLERQKLIRFPNGLVLSRSALDKLQQDLKATGWESFNVGQFKDRFGLTRKWAIPLLEHLDSIGTTRRVGDQRQLVRK